MKQSQEITDSIANVASQNSDQVDKILREVASLSPEAAEQCLARITASVRQIIQNNDRLQQDIGRLQTTLRQALPDEPVAQVYVKQLMSREVHTVPDSLLAVEAAKQMLERKIRHLVVVDRTGGLLGVLSDRDVLKHLSPWLSKSKVVDKDIHPNTLTVSDLMSSSVTTVRPDDCLAKAAGMMADSNIGCLPVIEVPSGHPVGMLTITDVLLHVANGQVPSIEPSGQMG